MNNQDQKNIEQQYNETDPQAFDRNDIKQVDQLLLESKTRDLNKSELNKIIDILKVAKESRIVFVNEELKKTENIYYETSRITKEIEKFQATFPMERQKSQQDFFNKAIKSDLDDLNRLLNEYQPILSDDLTKSYFDGIQLVETSFVKSLKGLNIKYESPAELKSEQEAELKAKQEAQSNKPNVTSHETINNEVIIEEKESESEKSIQENTLASNKSEEVNTKDFINTESQNKDSKNKIMRTSKSKKMK